jgi:predicted DNA-binding protein
MKPPENSRFSVILPTALRKRTQAVSRKLATTESNVVRLAVQNFVANCEASKLATNGRHVVIGPVKTDRPAG